MIKVLLPISSNATKGAKCKPFLRASLKPSIDFQATFSVRLFYCFMFRRLYRTNFLHKKPTNMKNRNNFHYLWFFLFFLSFNACQNSFTDSTIQEETPNYDINKYAEPTLGLQTRSGCGDVHWTYEGHEGPDHWAELCEDYEDCNGNRQSPIALKKLKTRRKSRALHFYWKEQTQTELVNNGHTLQFNVQPGSYLRLNGQKYNLLQFHFHYESEHTINGERLPLEVHFVHERNGKLAVIGVMVEEGAPNPLFDQFLWDFPESEGVFTSDDHYDPSDLLGDTKHFWYYDGSLTTPPCSEIVKWTVMEDYITASHDQIAHLKSILHDNFRPLQSQGSRQVRMQ